MRLSLAQPIWIGIAFMAALAVLMSRSLRFLVLTSQSSLKVITETIGVHNFLIRITPFRIGELSLPYLLAKHANEPWVRTTVSLVLVRLLELWVYLITGVIAALFFFKSFSFIEIVIGLPIIIVLSLVILTFGYWLQVFLRISNLIITRSFLNKFHFITRSLHQLDAIVQESEKLNAQSRILLGLSTAAVVLFQYLGLGALVYAFGLELGLTQIIVGVCLAQIFSALPLFTIGTVGTYELGWTIGFVWVGVSVEDAAITGIATQVVTLAFASAIAGVSSLALSKGSKDTVTIGQ